MLDPTKPVQTRDGRPVRIICTDAKLASKSTIVALVASSDKCPEYIVNRPPHGRVSLSLDNAEDLVNVPEKVNSFRNLYSEEVIGLEFHSLSASIKADFCNQRYGTLEYVSIADEVVDVIFHRRNN